MNEYKNKDTVTNLYSSRAALSLAVVFTVFAVCSIWKNLESGFGVLGSVLFAVFPILICVAVWIIYNSANNDRSIDVTGFSIIRIVVILKFIGYCAISGLILLEGALLAFVSFAYSGNADSYKDMFLDMYNSTIVSYGDSDVLGLSKLISGISGELFLDYIGVLGIVMALIALFFLVMVILYYVFLLKSVKSLREAAEGHAENKMFSKFVVFILYVLAVFTGIQIIDNMLFFVAGYGISSAFSEFIYYVVKFAMYVIIIICLNKYRTEMKKN